MVDTPRIDPQAFRSGNTRNLVPESGDLPSLRNAGVDTNVSQQVDSFVALAEDSYRLQQLSGEEYNQQIAVVKADQSITKQKRFSEALNGIYEGIEEIRATTEDINQIPQKTLDYYRDITKRIISESNDFSPFQKEELSKSFSEFENSIAKDTLNYQVQLRELERENNVEVILRETGALLSRNPGQFNAVMEQYGKSIQEIGFNDVEAQKLILASSASLTKTTIQAIAEQNPHAALEQVRSGKFDQFLSPTELASIKSSLNGTVKAVNKEAMERQHVESLIDSGVTLNPDSAASKKVGERLWTSGPAKDFQNFVQAGDFNAATTTATSFVARYGIVPEALTQELTGRAKVGSPTQRKVAITAIDTIMKENPQATLASFTAEEAAFVDRAARMLRYSDDPATTLMTLDNQLIQDQSRVKEYRENAKDEVSKLNIGKILKDEFKADVEAVGSLQARDDYRAHFTDYYTQNPDAKKAKEYATSNIKKTYGRNVVDGSNAIIKFPPTSFIDDSVVANSEDYLKYDFNEFVTKTIGGDTEKYDYYITNSPVTEKQANTFFSVVNQGLVPDQNLIPSYNVVRVSKENNLAEVLADEKGAMRYKPEIPNPERAGEFLRAQRGGDRGGNAVDKSKTLLSTILMLNHLSDDKNSADVGE